MAFSSSAKANFVTNVRAAYANVLAADAQLTALINESNDNGYTWVDGDFTGANAGIIATDFTTALTQAGNWHTALSLGAAVGGGAPATLPSGIRALFSKVSK